MKRILSKILLYGLLLLGVFITIGVLFLNFSPQFGQPPTSKEQQSYTRFQNYQDGTFVNERPTSLDIDYIKMFKEWSKHAPNRSPSLPIEVDQINSAQLTLEEDTLSQLIWFGHSAFLLQMDKKNILIDPMLGVSPSPIAFLGPQRYSKNLPMVIGDLPFIDAVLISHDHYDHLDYESIMELKDKVGHFFVPMGVGSHLHSWGITKDKITEMNWWDTAACDSIQFVCTPARHFSGRGFSDNAATLWSSWVIKGTTQTLFFSGDSGYDTHFREIGDKYGPFDLSLLECGQYNELWKEIHLMPEETVQAAIDLKSDIAMPIHWGAFTLALHDWTEPVERMQKKAKELNVLLTTPRIGQPILLDSKEFPSEKWWEQYMVNGK